MTASLHVDDHPDGEQPEDGRRAPAPVPAPRQVPIARAVVSDKGVE